MTDRPLLESRELTMRFGGLVAVDAVDLSIAAGAIHSVIGPNGAGKTTLINLLTGIYRPTHGAILLEGREITGRRPYDVTRLGLSRTFQNIRLFRPSACWRTSWWRSISVAGSR